MFLGKLLSGVRGPGSGGAGFARLTTGVGMAVGIVLATAGGSTALSTRVAVQWGSWYQYSQQESNWCWAAGAQMILQKVLGSSPTQCVLVKYGKDTAACANSTGTMSELNEALYDAGVTASGSWTGIAPFSVVRNRTTAGAGVLTRVAWDGGGPVGHIAPLIGSATVPDRVYITRIREGAVSGSWISYSAFVNGTAGLGGVGYTPTHYLYN